MLAALCPLGHLTTNEHPLLDAATTPHCLMSLCATPFLVIHTYFVPVPLLSPSDCEILSGKLCSDGVLGLGAPFHVSGPF